MGMETGSCLSRGRSPILVHLQGSPRCGGGGGPLGTSLRDEPSQGGPWHFWTGRKRDLAPGRRRERGFFDLALRWRKDVRVPPEAGLEGRLAATRQREQRGPDGTSIDSQPQS